MADRFSPAAVHALREALVAIYWYKKDLRRFLEQVVRDRRLVADLDWTTYKVQIVSRLLDDLCMSEAEYREDLEALCSEVCKLRDFSHLNRLEDGSKKVVRATEAVQVLREIWDSHERVVEDIEAIAERRKQQLERQMSSDAFTAQLAELKQRFFGFIIQQGAQRRGYELEKLLYDLFTLFDLDPKASFRVVGEQIDGAFSLEGTDYNLEAKWQKNPVALDALDGFDGKIRRRLKTALGLFLSIEGFSEQALTRLNGQTLSFILMDGSDLVAVLEGRIDLTSLLIAKRQHASQTGNPLYKAFTMLSGS